MDYSFLNLANLDQITRQYYDMLYQKVCRLGPSQKAEGASAVQFFQLSGLNLQTLREIWNLSSVYKQSFLNQMEFYLYLKYISLAQANQLSGNPYLMLKQVHA